MFVHRAEIEWDGTFGPSATVTGNVTICRGREGATLRRFLGCQWATVPRARRLYCDDARGSPSQQLTVGRGCIDGLSKRVFTRHEGG